MRSKVIPTAQGLGFVLALVGASLLSPFPPSLYLSFSFSPEVQMATFAG